MGEYTSRNVIYIYIYIYRERERERDGNNYLNIIIICHISMFTLYCILYGQKIKCTPLLP